MSILDFDIEPIQIKSTVWYKAKDIVSLLGFSSQNVTNIVTKVIPESHRKKYFDGNYMYWIIDLYGVSQLVIRSNSEFANSIKEKLFDEIIPSMIYD